MSHSSSIAVERIGPWTRATHWRRIVGWSAIVLLAGCGGGIIDDGRSASASIDAEDADPATFRPAPTDIDILSREHLARIAGVSLALAQRDFRSLRYHLDEDGLHHTRYQQVFDGVPVFGGEAYVHLLPDGSMQGVTDDRGIL